MTHVDLNCDLAEGQGDDGAILPFVTSANVACGLHAGGPTEMWRTVDQAVRLGVAVGAHPGFADRARFGRVELELAAGEIYDLIAYQIGALQAFVRRAGGALAHVKPHGALYHQAARRGDIAEAIARATRETAGQVILVGAPASEMQAAARGCGLSFAAEGFADRTYGEDGRLLPRSDPRALVEGDDAAVAARAVEMVRTQRAPTAGGGWLDLPLHTLCLHGDDPRAAGRARVLRAALEAAGITVAPLGAWLR
jgi:5-oxoprolinase (ATP-hydrolysing) subunit A